MTKEKRKFSVKTYIALAVFFDAVLNIAFSALLEKFIDVFYSGYAHMTVWGDVAAIISLIISFIIYDSFAHAAYHGIKSRLMFLGTVYVASKAAGIVHYLTAMLVNLLTANAGDAAQSVVAVLLAVFEIALDIILSVWLIEYFEDKIAAQKKESAEITV